MQHAELMWILSCTASMGYLGRMTQYKVSYGPAVPPISIRTFSLSMYIVLTEATE